MFEDLSLGAIAIYACFVYSAFLFEAVYGVLVTIVAVILLLAGLHGNPLSFASVIVLAIVNCSLALWKTGRDPHEQLLNIDIDFSFGRGGADEGEAEGDETAAVSSRQDLKKEQTEKKKRILQSIALVLLVTSGAALYLLQTAEKPVCPPSPGELMYRQAVQAKDSGKMAEAAALMKTEVPRKKRCPE